MDMDLLFSHAKEAINIQKIDSIITNGSIYL